MALWAAQLSHNGFVTCDTADKSLHLMPTVLSCRHGAGCGQDCADVMMRWSYSAGCGQDCAGVTMRWSYSAGCGQDCADVIIIIIRSFIRKSSSQEIHVIKGA